MLLKQSAYQNFLLIHRVEKTGIAYAGCQAYFNVIHLPAMSITKTHQEKEASNA